MSSRERRTKVEEGKGSNKMNFHVITSIILMSVSSLGLPTTKTCILPHVLMALLLTSCLT